jgi:hypothetical protein
VGSSELVAMRSAAQELPGTVAGAVAAALEAGSVTRSVTACAQCANVPVHTRRILIPDLARDHSSAQQLDILSLKPWTPEATQRQLSEAEQRTIV